MLQFLIRYSLQQRGLVVAFALAILALGVKTALELPVEVLPDLTKPTVTILTEASGFAPEEVETLVTVPLEGALMGVTGLTRIRSINDVGLSLIFVEFDWGADVYQARQFVQERLATVGEILPEGVSPYMTPVASLMGNILLVGMVDPSGRHTPSELRSLADWSVTRRLQGLPGIAEALSMGGGVRQMQIQPNPEAMLAYGVRMDELRAAAAEAVGNSTGGFIESSSREIMVRNLSMTTDVSRVADTVVRHDGGYPVRIGDVAEVVWDVVPMRGDAGLASKRSTGGQGFSGVVISVTKSPGFDTIGLTREVEAALAGLETTLPEGVKLVTLYRQADFIELAVGNLQEALRDGALMVAVVLFLFLLHLRITLITLTAIPLSLAMTAVVFNIFGLSVNSMTLGGLAVAIGMVVDDAIVDVENVFRRLRENAALAEPLPRLEVIARASTEVRSSILYATVLVILAFAPLLALSGLEGRLFSPIALATIVSMASSFVVSLTVIPALCSLLLRPKGEKTQKEGIVIRGFKRAFGATWLRLSLAQPLLVVALTLGLLVVAVIVSLGMGRNFLPSFREPTVLVATTLAPGTSLAQTTRTALVAQDQLLRIEEVDTVGFRVGRAERGDHVVPVSTVEFDIEFTQAKGRERGEILAEIRETMRGFPGTFSVVSGPLADRVGHMLSGVSAKVAVKVYGPDLAKLQDLGGQVLEIARSIPGMEEARGEQQAPIPQLRIEIERERALAYGVTPGGVNEQLAALLGGEVLAELYADQRVFELALRLPPSWRESPERLATLMIETLDGWMVPLGEVAHIRMATGPSLIARENAQRRYVVSINPTVDDLSYVVERLQEEVRRGVALPTGYSVSFEGEYAAQQEATRTIVIMSLAALLVVSALLYSYFRSMRFAVLVLTNLPISLFGGALLTWATLDNISIATLVGFIAIGGIAARNNIMLISHYLHLMRQEGVRFSRELVVRGTQERLVPVLMTALSAGIALVPLVFAAGDPGKEILNPVAIVIVGGLASSTLLGLGVTPALFLALGRKAAERSVALESAASE